MCVCARVRVRDGVIPVQPSGLGFAWPDFAELAVSEEGGEEGEAGAPQCRSQCAVIVRESKNGVSGDAGE